MKILLSTLIIFVVSGLFQVTISTEIVVEKSVRKIHLLEMGDSTKVELLLDLSRGLDGQPVEAMLAARSALDLAEQNSFLILIGKCYERISLCKRDLGDYSSAINYSFRALRIYDEQNLSNRTGALQLQIGTHFGAENNYPKAITYISQALNSFQQRKDSTNIVLAMINLGETYRLDGNADSAAILFEECLELNQKLNNDYVEMVKAMPGVTLDGICYPEQRGSSHRTAEVCHGDSG
ncbi:tetratricopeptide repeat protein [Marinilabilia salmonicolor]|uniref:tetratricopeptide repeat protein n=1 Tax=Marinilabilia salmonicolor TaxID=989 RepID=UPI00046950B1|nr:tetratricopeptide repeat protein [Marinilabilia salmonicolor]